MVLDTLKKVCPKTDVGKGVYDADYEALELLLPLAAKIVYHTAIRLRRDLYAPLRPRLPTTRGGAVW